jgi:predicted ATPase/DNA-binding CsgD family transcriptional regulator
VATRTAGLPADLTSFVGRRQEVTELTRLLSEARLVTLKGGAGTGKTRLALRVASRLARAFPDGLWLVELAGIADPALIEYTVAQTLQVAEDDGSSPADLLARFLRHRQALLVLDNCEHLVRACAVLADRLLAEAPGLRILVTSRHVLEVMGEHVYPVRPLAVDDSAGGHGPAVDLFVQRAAAAVPGFALDDENTPNVVEVCRRLEGNPLAVELAAVRLRVLSPRQLAERLQDRFRTLSSELRSRPERQRTLRAAVEWSYQLCTPAEQLMWAAASVFAGGFDLESAEEVCTAAGLEPFEMLDVLDGLVSKSILLFERNRYRLLETLREFGAEKLDEPSRVRRAHARRYLRLAEQAEREWFGPAQARWLGWARDEHDNLRVALDFLLGSGDDQAALRLATALWFDWMAAAQPSEGRLWLARALDRPGGDPDSRTRALWASSLALTLAGDPETGLSLAEEATEGGSGDPLTVARIVNRRAGIAVHLRDFATSERLAREAMARFAEAGAPADPMMVIAHLTVSACRLAQGDPGGAVAECRRAEAICRAAQDRSLLVLVLVFLARAEWSAGNLADADEHGRQALLTARAGAARPYLVQAVDVVAAIAASLGDHTRAAVLLGGSDALWKNFGLAVLRDSPHFATPRRECEKNSRAALGPAGFRAAFDRGVALGLDGVIGYATGRQPAAGSPEPRSAPSGPLTRRETEIADLVGRGLTNREIAEKLVISRRTVESHVENILAKLDFASRSQIAAWTVTQS